MTDRPRLNPDPDGGFLLHLPDCTSIDTQVWSVDIGLTAEALAALRALLTAAPAEHCGDMLPGLDGASWYECVLRPGHHGSHADNHQRRWADKPKAPGAEVRARLADAVHAVVTAPDYRAHCCRGDCAPSVDECEAMRQRAERAERFFELTAESLEEALARNVAAGEELRQSSVLMEAVRIWAASTVHHDAAMELLAALNQPKPAP